MTADELMDAYEECISYLRKAQSRQRIPSLKRISLVNFTIKVYLNIQFCKHSSRWPSSILYKISFNCHCWCSGVYCIWLSHICGMHGVSAACVICDVCRNALQRIDVMPMQRRHAVQGNVALVVTQTCSLVWFVVIKEVQLLWCILWSVVLRVEDSYNM